MHPHVVVAGDAIQLAEAGARVWAEACRHALAARGAFHVALSGGETPKAIYRAVARVSDLDFAWHRTHVYWGDERAVPPGDERSNFGMAKKALFDEVPLADAQIHRIRGEADDLEAEARRYANELPERFDLLWLGVGEDGHTASIFPRSPALDEASSRVLAVDGPGGQPPRRITLTLPALNASRRVVVVASGREKATVVARARAALANDAAGPDLPIARVRPASGHLVWLLDAAAAGT